MRSLELTLTPNARSSMPLHPIRSLGATRRSALRLNLPLLGSSHRVLCFLSYLRASIRMRRILTLDVADTAAPGPPTGPKPAIFGCH